MYQKIITPYDIYLKEVYVNIALLVEKNVNSIIMS